MLNKVKAAAVRVIKGKAPGWPCGWERITTIRGAMLWRLGSLPGMDASADGQGRVVLFRVK